MNGRHFFRRIWPPILVFASLIAGWYGLAYSLDNNFASGNGAALIVPPPHQLLTGLNGATRDRIVSATFISASTALVGLLLAIIIGIAIGVLMNLSRAIESAIWPWLIALQVTPIIVITPIIIRVVGPSFGARVFVTVLISFFPIASNTLFGLRSVSQALHDLFTLGNFSRRQQLVQLELPAASPYIFAGLRVSAGLAVIGAIVGDFFFTRGTPGLGRLITNFFLDTRSGPMFVTAIVATILGLGFFIAVEIMRKLLVSPWHRN